MRILVVGQGIAGSVLAYTLQEAGCPTDIMDPNPSSSASKVAAGIIDPLAGQRYLLAWQATSLLPVAIAFYRSLEYKFKTRFFFPLPMIRFFNSSQDVSAWRKKKVQSPASHYFDAILSPRSYPLAGTHGGVTISATGYLNTPYFLTCMRDYFIEKNRYIQGVFSEKKAHDATYNLVIFCEGYAASANPLFGHLPFQSVQGDCLDILCPSLGEDHILHQNKFILPTGSSVFRVGATYNRQWDNSSPTPLGANELVRFLTGFIPGHPYILKNHLSGIRPAVQDGRPIIGIHPQFPHIGIFNGLGSRAVMSAPYLANMWRDFLRYKTHIPKEISLDRFATIP